MAIQNKTMWATHTYKDNYKVFHRGGGGGGGGLNRFYVATILAITSAAV